MPTVETDDPFREVIQAISTIKAYSDPEGITLDVEKELVQRNVVGSVAAKPTGREVLVIRIPYDRSPAFLQRQIELLQLEKEKLKYSESLADDEIADLQSELSKQS